MQREDFSFDLPESLIAQSPVDNRSDSRLLVFNKAQKSITHEKFTAITKYLNPGDLLVMNNTKVMAARLFGQKKTGGKLELLVERILDERIFVAQIKSSKAPKEGSTFNIGEEAVIKVKGRRDAMFVCEVISDHTIYMIINEYGHIPLPPYIERNATTKDLERYQTVFAKHEGAVAAPTAGLHFDQDLLNTLQEKGINFAFLTLHVGAGTFQPVRVDDIETHKMHSEWLEVDKSVVDSVAQTKSNGGRVIAVGTTAVRALETAALDGTLQTFEGDTDIFLYPGKSFNVIDGMVTNFHLPESTLLMLVAAFIGTDEVKNLYQEAIAHSYRFFSYGDSSLLI